MKQWFMLLVTTGASCCGGLLLLPPYVLANIDNNPQLLTLEEEAPPGFAELFASQKGPVIIDLYGEELVLPGESKFRFVAIDPSGKGKLTAFLAGQGVKAEAQTEIATRLLNGVESSSQCRGLIAQCAIYPQHLDFSFDDQNRRLRIFVNEANLDFSRQERFFEMTHRALSVVNQSSLYLQKSNHYTSGDWQNSTALSLPLGYLRADTTFSHSDNQRLFEVYEANYVVDRKGYSLSAGYQTSLAIDNSAFALLAGQNASTYHATLFSNQRLKVRSQSRFDYLSVFVPESTEIEIIREGQMLYRGMIPQGLNKISLAPFPTGSYNVDVIYRVGGQVTKEEVRHIYNVPVFIMAKGDYDWLATGGKLHDNQYGQYSYLKAAVNGRFFDTLVTGAGYGNVDGDSFFLGYEEFAPHTRFRSALGATADLHGNTFFNGEIHLFSFYFTGEWLHGEDDRFRSLFNNNTYRMLSAGVPFSLLGGYFNLSYNEYCTDGEVGEAPIKTRSVFFNASKNYPWFQLSGTVQYNFKAPGSSTNSGNDKGNWYVSVNVEIPLGPVTFASNYADSTSHQSVLRNTLRGRKQLGQRASVSGEYTLTSGNDNFTGHSPSSSGLLGANYENDYFATNGSLYAEQNNGYNANLNLYSSQLMDKNTFLFTSGTHSKSCLLVHNSVATDPTAITDDDTVGYLELRNKSLNSTSVTTLNRRYQVIPLTEYSQYQVKTSSKGTRFLGTTDINGDYFSKPGAFLKIDNQVALVNQYIVSFINEQGDLVHDLHCHGPDCVRLESITDGVYQVTLFAGTDFTLRSGADICLLPASDDAGGVMNAGRSVCVSEHTLKTLMAGMPDDYRLYYLGVSPSVSQQLMPNMTYVRVGKIYARFLFAKTESLPAGEFIPREVRLPVNPPPVNPKI